jgi:hypothetical protein
MLKKILTGTVAVFFAAGLATAANLSIFSGPQDPSQLLATINTLVQNINFGVNGRLTAVVTPAGNTTAIEQTLMTYTLPANRIANTGDAVRVRCWGNTATNSNAKTLKMYFGSTSFSSSTAGGAPNNKAFDGELLVVRSGAAAQNIVARIGYDVTLTTVQNSTSGTDSWAANQTIKCTSTTVAASDMTIQGMYVDQVK